MAVKKINNFLCFILGGIWHESLVVWNKAVLANSVHLPGEKSNLKSLCTDCLMHVFFSYSTNTTLNLRVYSFDHALE